MKFFLGFVAGVLLTLLIGFFALLEIDRVHSQRQFRATTEEIRATVERLKIEEINRRGEAERARIQQLSDDAVRQIQNR